VNDYIEKIIKLTTQLILPGLMIVCESLREIVKTIDSALVQSYINLMNFRIGSIIEHKGKAPLSFAFQKIICK